MINKRINITQKNFLLFLYIIILGLFGPVVYWVSNHNTQLPFAGKAEKNPIQKRMSVGEKILVTAHNYAAKQEGTTAFANGNYVIALEKFHSSLKRDRNDPEARIYLNNTIAAKSDSYFRIGVSVPIGGNLNVAQEILRGVAQAQEKINRDGGIGGKLLMVEIANDDNNPEVAQAVAEKFVRDQKILAVVGHNDSNASIAAAPTYQEGGLVMVTPTSSAESLTGMGNYIFRSTPSTRNLADTLANYAVQVAGKDNIAMCIDSDSKVSASFKDNFTWAVYNYGGKVSPLNCDLAAADFSPEEIPSQAISQGADALLLAPSVRKVGKALEIVSGNDDRLTLLGTHSFNTYSTLEDGRNSVNGMVLSVPWYQKPVARNSFIINAQELWGGGVNWRTAMAYDATQTVSQAIASGADRQNLQQTIANPEFSTQGATSEISFLPSGDRNLQGGLVKIKPGKKSGTGYDFVALDLEKNIKASAKLNPKDATTTPQLKSR